MTKKIRLSALESMEEGETVIVVGTVVRKYIGERYTRLIIDDFEGVAPATAFDMDLNDIDIGDVVKIVGVVRERNGKVLVIRGVKKVSICEELVHRLEADKGEEVEIVETVELGANDGV